MLRFLLNDEEVAEESLPADLTVLDYLRMHRHKCGTKEGCASGDCGACTVVVASVSSDKQSLNYRSINSCITFMGTMQGVQLITVEDLKHNEQLHPVQQAMVKHHGSQCGFCTPGFVMSLFALVKNMPALPSHDAKNTAPEVNTESSNRELINEYLAGNLCRCTGYRPIVDAALEAMAGAATPDQFDSSQQTTVQALLDMQHDSNELKVRAAPATGGFYLPSSISELAALRARFPDAKLLAGGTDLALDVTQKLESFDTMVSVQSVAGFDAFIVNQRYLELGAGMSLTDCAQNLAGYYPEVKKLLHRFGSTQVRNQGTVGGNIANASPIGDLPPVFIALNASVLLHSVGGDRELAIGDFFVGYRQTQLRSNEVVRAIRIPLSYIPPASQLKVYKISKRLDDDISAVCAVFNVSMHQQQVADVSIAFGGMAEIPRRAPATEKALRGKMLTADVLSAASIALEADFQPITDMRASAEYRMKVARNLLQRLAVEMAAPTSTSTNAATIATQVADYVL